MSVVSGSRDGERVTMGRRGDSTTSRAAKATRRLQMHTMRRNGCNNTEIAAYFRYTVRHVRRELAAYREERADAQGLRSAEPVQDD